MQLIKITTTPIEYTMQIENASLKANRNEPAKITPRVTQGKFDIKSENIKVQLDTSAARQSLGAPTLGQFARENGQKGLQAAQNAMAQYAEIGNQLADIHKGTTIPAVYAQLSTKVPVTGMVFLPNKGADISWRSNYIEMKYTPSKINSEYQQAKFSMEYVPAKVKMQISQYPSVSIEYVGGPNYVPRSADPSYVPPVE